MNNGGPFSTAYRSEYRHIGLVTKPRIQQYDGIYPGRRSNAEVRTTDSISTQVDLEIELRTKRVGRCGEASSDKARALTDSLPEESQCRLWACVCLRQHRGACLHQDIVSGKFRTFFRDVRILDAARSGADVIFQDGELLSGVAQPGYVRPNRGAVGRKLSDGRFHVRECRGGVGGGGHRAGRRRGVGAGAEIDSAHRERVPIAVRRDSARRAGKQTHPIEIFGGKIVDVAPEGGELCVVEPSIRVRLRRVLSQNRQFTHTIQCLANLLQETILRLAERHCIRDVGFSRADPVDLRVEPQRYRHACRIIFGRNDLRSRG